MRSARYRRRPGLSSNPPRTPGRRSRCRAIGVPHDRVVRVAAARCSPRSTSARRWRITSAARWSALRDVRQDLPQLVQVRRVSIQRAWAASALARIVPSGCSGSGRGRRKAFCGFRPGQALKPCPLTANVVELVHACRDVDAHPHQGSRSPSFSPTPRPREAKPAGAAIGVENPKLGTVSFVGAQRRFHQLSRCPVPRMHPASGSRPGQSASGPVRRALGLGRGRKRSSIGRRGSRTRHRRPPPPGSGVTR